MHFKTFKVPNAGRDWAASGTLHYIGMLHEIFTFLLMRASSESSLRSFAHVRSVAIAAHPVCVRRRPRPHPVHPLLYALLAVHAERPLARARDDAKRSGEAARVGRVRETLHAGSGAVGLTAAGSRSSMKSAFQTAAQRGSARLARELGIHRIWNTIVNYLTVYARSITTRPVTHAGVTESQDHGHPSYLTRS